MWISIIQICIVAYVWILGKGGIGEAALLNLVLTVRQASLYCGDILLTIECDSGFERRPYRPVHFVHSLRMTHVAD